MYVQTDRTSAPPSSLHMNLRSGAHVPATTCFGFYISLDPALVCQVCCCSISMEMLTRNAVDEPVAAPGMSSGHIHFANIAADRLQVVLQGTIYRTAAATCPAIQ